MRPTANVLKFNILKSHMICPLQSKLRIFKNIINLISESYAKIIGPNFGLGIFTQVGVYKLNKRLINSEMDRTGPM
jgi:hypothetical protein